MDHRMPELKSMAPRAQAAAAPLPERVPAPPQATGFPAPISKDGYEYEEIILDRGGSGENYSINSTNFTLATAWKNVKDIRQCKEC